MRRRTIRQIDKERVLEALRRQVAEDLQAITRSQQASHQGATHEESRAENAKDTRALESTYLARGLAERVAELRNAATALATLVTRHYDPDEEIGLAALVTLELERGDAEPQIEHYFITSLAGGLQLEIAGHEVVTLTPRSPLGRALLGKCSDDEVEFRTPQGPRVGTVLSVA